LDKITFIGAGSFGTALGVLISKKGYEVHLFDRCKETIQDINEKRENVRYLHNVVIPSNVQGYTDMAQAIEGSKYIFLAVPSHAIREVSKKIKEFLNEDQIIVNMAKGMEQNTEKRLSEVIKEELPNNPVVVISGPSHAEEIAEDLPTTLVATSENMEFAFKVQDLLMTNKLRVYTNSDIIGIEIGGAVKNIIALAAGISDGIGYGDNTKAALMTRGMSEIIKVGVKLGGKLETFYGLTGMGDLIVTCTSMHSRNRRAGIMIGKGKSCKEACKEVGMVVEGVKACEIFYRIKEKLDISMPITDILYKVLFENKDPKYGVHELMSRDKKNEII
jgi:glycerol-3-phosphate dehydrogenase (NAD(P)+)